MGDLTQPDCNDLDVLTQQLADTEMRELQLQADYDHLKQMFELAPFGYQSLDENGCFLDVNQTWLTLLGYSREEVIGKNFAAFLLPGWQPIFQERFPQFKELGEVKSVEFELVRKDGSTITVSFDGKIGRDAAGRFQKTHCFFRDITERKKAEAYQEIGREIFQILNGMDTLSGSIHSILDVLKKRTGFDAVGIRLKESEDFPFYAHQGYVPEFVSKENSLIEYTESGEVYRDKDGKARLACLCGLVLSGSTDCSSRFFTEEGSFWVNDSRPLLNIAPDADSRFNPRNLCIYHGFSSIALIPIKVKKEIIGLVHFSNKRKGSFSLHSITLLENIVSQIGEAILRKQAEAALLAERQRLNDIIAFLPDPTFAIDKDGRVIIWNRAIEEMTGLSASKMVGRGDYAYSIPFYGVARPQLIDLIFKNDEEVASWYPHIMRERDTLTTEVFCKALYNGNGGAWVYAKASPLHDQSGNIIGAIESVRDITEQKVTEDRLKKSIAWFKALFNATSDSVILVKSDGTILDLNDNAAKRRTKCPDMLRGQNLFDYLPPEAASTRRMAIDEVLHERRLIQYDEARENQYYRIRLFPILDRQGEVIQIASFSRDITENKKVEEERRKLEARLIQSQKMEAIGTLAGGIAHDFNNILGAILGYAEMAQEAESQDPLTSKYLGRIRESGERASALVRQILAFSRQAESKRLPLMPNLIIQDAIKLLRPSLPSTISIKLNLNANVSFILADSTQIHQVIINLCTNAFHAMEQKGGVLTIELCNKTLSSSDLQHVPDVQPGDFVELAIRDTGTGIHPDIRQKIFDPYFTTKEVGKGTGMGLSIVHGIVTSHAGFISCESEVGKGTVFRISLPVTEQVATSGRQELVSVPLGIERVLFVDDEEVLVELGVLMLEGLGYQVTGKTRSLDALATFRDHPDAFDAVITDYTMPGMTGSDLAIRILQMRPDIPVILCSGYSNLISEEKARMMGIRGFAKKPLTKQEIASLLRMLLDEAKTSGGRHQH